jgi:hypothetical protein
MRPVVAVAASAAAPALCKQDGGQFEARSCADAAQSAAAMPAALRVWSAQPLQARMIARARPGTLPKSEMKAQPSAAQKPQSVAQPAQSGEPGAEQLEA